MKHITHVASAERWRRYDLRRRQHERVGASLFRRLFGRQGREVLAQLPRDRLPTLTELMSYVRSASWETPVRSWLAPMVRSEFNLIMQTLVELRAQEPFEGQRVAAEYARERGGALVRAIDQATRASLSDMLARGILEGWTGDEFANNIRSLYQRFSLARADRIARTETTAALSFGSIEAAKSSGIRGLVKVWLSAADGRTRPSHQIANGQERPIAVPFVVGGAHLDYPGDSKGPAGEVVNCRCTIVYRIAR